MFKDIKNVVLRFLKQKNKKIIILHPTDYLILREHCDTKSIKGIQQYLSDNYGETTIRWVKKTHPQDLYAVITFYNDKYHTWFNMTHKFKG